MVDREKRREMSKFRRLGERRLAIIEDQPAILMANPEDSVVLMHAAVTHQQQTQVFGANPELTQCDVLCNCVIFTIALSARKGRKRCRPQIKHRVLPLVADIPDSQIDRPVDRFDCQTGRHLPCFVDKRQKAECGRRWALIPIGLTLRQDAFVGADFAREDAPLDPQQPLGGAKRHQAEGLALRLRECADESGASLTTFDVVNAIRSGLLSATRPSCIARTSLIVKKAAGGLLWGSVSDNAGSIAATTRCSVELEGFEKPHAAIAIIET